MGTARWILVTTQFCPCGSDELVTIRVLIPTVTEPRYKAFIALSDICSQEVGAQKRQPLCLCSVLAIRAQKSRLGNFEAVVPGRLIRDGLTCNFARDEEYCWPALVRTSRLFS